MTAYEIDNRAYAEDDAELPAALKRAHGGDLRPLCLCRPFSAKLLMVIERRTANGQNARDQKGNAKNTPGHDLYILRRMPGRGHEHNPACKHYEAPEGLSGRTEHLGGAIRTDDDGAHHILRLAFPLSHKEKAAPTDETVKVGEPAKSRRRFTRLSLPGFLHHVLETAELNKMHKGLHAKRNAIASLLLTDTGDSGTAVFLIDEQPTDAQALAMKAIEDKGILRSQPTHSTERSLSERVRHARWSIDAGYDVPQSEYCRNDRRLRQSIRCRFPTCFGRLCA
jgi:Protein of unknown function (DUF1173)